MTESPVLETQRLRLRGWRESDFDPYARMMADADVARFIGGAMARNDAWRSMATIIGHWAVRGYGFWVVERKTDGAFLGRIGLWQPEGWPGVEVGWGLDRPYWGQGYASEAAHAAFDHGFRTLPVARLISLIDPKNTPSQRVAERLGEVKGAPATIVLFGNSYTLDVWEMTRERWQAARARA
ncbi:MAG: GNAT family N-acetyltransferase [Alphaproteobacteria bacterium]|nr:GNAT family N-acetyltransferase [Alphaproteobacteria bacterium]